MNSPMSNNSGKNITFSYSNKDLNKEFAVKHTNSKLGTKIMASKRCSIELDSNQMSQFAVRSEVKN